MLERATEGAWGDMNAEIGIEAPEMLRLDDEYLGPCPCGISFAEGGRLARLTVVLALLCLLDQEAVDLPLGLSPVRDGAPDFTNVG